MNSATYVSRRGDGGGDGGEEAPYPGLEFFFGDPTSELFWLIYLM